MSSELLIVPKKKGIGGHQSAKMITDQWLTPPEIIHALGPFDLDPCSPIKRPFETAKNYFTVEDDGLKNDWSGRVWLNPPYGRKCASWLKKISDHMNGVAIIFARTETDMFFRYVWEKADSILFVKGRIHFYTVDGKRAKANAGAPSVLVAYGEENVQSLSDSGIKGKHLLVNSVPIVVVEISPSWKCVVSVALSRINGPAQLQTIYELVEQIAPDKVDNNKFYKEKIRQKLQEHFTKISKGVYCN
jgi:phage N-6-adenine-methyltransferase